MKSVEREGWRCRWYEFAGVNSRLDADNCCEVY